MLNFLIFINLIRDVIRTLHSRTRRALWYIHDNPRFPCYAGQDSMYGGLMRLCLLIRVPIHQLDPFSDPRIELCADDGVLEAYNAEGNLVYSSTTEGIK